MAAPFNSKNQLKKGKNVPTVPRWKTRSCFGSKQKLFSSDFLLFLSSKVFPSTLFDMQSVAVIQIYSEVAPGGCCHFRPSQGTQLKR